jgi:hypothetical protein
MRVLMSMLLSWLAVLAVTPTVHGEPSKKPEISFSIPFLCVTGEERRGRCLGDEFKPGLKVVLMSRAGNCRAKTADTFIWEHPLSGYKFPVTRLIGSSNCLTVETEERALERFDIAVVGAEPAAVRVVIPKDDKSMVSKKMELQARKLAESYIKREFRKSYYPTSVSDAKPKVFRKGNVTLRIFELQSTIEKGTFPWEPGPTVALTNTGVFLLEGLCTYGVPKFFSVNDKLYLTYKPTLGCCGCGNIHFFVYDVSSGTPKKVYENGKFGD